MLFQDRGKTKNDACSRKRIEPLVLSQEKVRSKASAAEIEELDRYVDRLADTLEEHVKVKLKRDFRIGC